MIDAEVALGHDPFQLPTGGTPQMPATAKDDHLGFEMSPLNSSGRCRPMQPKADQIGQTGLQYYHDETFVAHQRPRVRCDVQSARSKMTRTIIKVCVTTAGVLEDRT